MQRLQLCYERSRLLLAFRLGKALKGKSAKEVADSLTSCLYLYGAPRILQSGKSMNLIIVEIFCK